MAQKDGGKYFYLMLKENFYDSDDMILLEGMENGYKYSNILLKLYLKSLKDKGKLMYKDRIPYNVEMLAKITRHDIDTVRQAIRVFKEMGIIEILDNGAIFMLDIENYIGRSSTEADRRRKYDRRIAEEKQKLLENKVQCEKSCEKSHEHINTNTNTDIELDININKNNIIYIPQKNEEKNVFEQEFEEIWKIYPNKQGKKNALTKYIKARKSGTTYEEVVEGLKKYLIYCYQNKDWYKPKNGETWFNKQSWNDELTIKTNDTKSLSELGVLDFSKFKD